MQNVPQIVRERLRATPPAVDHPDADVLTAFAERSLLDAERALVIEHLARCGDCRDIVALALPEPDAAHAVTVPARGGWLTWPALRWGFAAAGIVVIASFGVLEYQRSRPAMTVAKQSRQVETAQVQPPPVAENAPAREQHKTLNAAQPTAAAQAANPSVILSEPKRLNAPSPAVNAPQSRAAGGRSIGGPIPYGPHMPMQQQQQTATNQLQAVMPAAPMAKQQQSAGASANLRVPSASPSVNGESVAIQTSQAEVQAQNQPAPFPSQPAERLFDKDASAQLDKVDKAKPAVNVTGRELTQLVALAPRWAINSAGGLQRSFDQGKTWQDVDVTASAGLSAAKSLTAANAARAKDYYAEKKTLKAPASAPVFHSVAITGSDVWAGGSPGALYHSLDGGNHWTQVVPASAGVSLTGDIVGLEFSDAQNGKITTSTGEVWTTSDQGQTWQKQ